MEPWFSVSKDNVIDILEKRKDCFPWGDHPDEKFRCLIFVDDGAFYMTVDEFYDTDVNTFECIRFYTTFIADSIDEYKKLSEEEIVKKAYNAWCTGSR